MLGSLEWYKYSIVNIVFGKYVLIVLVRRNICLFVKLLLNFCMGFMVVWNEKVNFNF